jgi:uncharacterized LabA/DUF88 family protein
LSKFVILVDGFNLYHSLKNLSNPEPVHKWLSPKKLVSHFYPDFTDKDEFYYFTAIVPWDRLKAQRQQVFIRAIKSEGGIVVYGKFKLVDKECPKCKQQYQKYEEKQTDVNIATYLLKFAQEDRFDIAIIVSGDSDLIPAVREVLQKHPKKKIGVVVPYGRKAEELINTCSFRSHINESHILNSLYPLSIKTGNGKTITCPPKWNPAHP